MIVKDKAENSPFRLPSNNNDSQLPFIIKNKIVCKNVEINIIYPRVAFVKSDVIMTKFYRGKFSKLTRMDGFIVFMSLFRRME